MNIQIHNKNILDIREADTLILPVDGSAPGLEGNIARQFMKRVGVEEMHELYSPPPYYPFNGDTHWSRWLPFDETHFRHICCLGILSHDPDANHEGYISSAFDRMLGMARMDPGVGENIACPVLRGGHRLKYVDAIFLMIKIIEKNRNSAVTIHIAESDTERFGILSDVVG